MVEVVLLCCILLDHAQSAIFFVENALDEMILDLLRNIKSTDSDVDKYDAHDTLLYRVSTFQANLILCSSTHW